MSSLQDALAGRARIGRPSLTVQPEGAEGTIRRMRTLQLVQSLMAAGLAVFGLIALFGVGVTGLLVLLPAALLAAIAVATETRSKSAVLVALAVDAVLATLAAVRLTRLLTVGSIPGQDPNIHMAPSVVDLTVPVVTLLLSVLAFIAVLVDWKSVRAAKWF